MQIIELTRRLEVAEAIAARAGALALRYFHDRDSLHIEAKHTLPTARLRP
jgi:myo-inositol-1(or 4)-monophosphatase